MFESLRTILVPTDFSELSETALRSAAALAKRHAASIHLLHVIRMPMLYTGYEVSVPQAVWEGVRQGTRVRMEEARRLLDELGVAEMGEIISDSIRPDEAIERSVKDLDADLVVMATHGRRGLKHAFVGSVTERTLRSCPVPVLAIKGGGLAEQPIRKILLPTDFSAHSKKAMALACDVAKRYDAEIDVLHVLDESPEFVRLASAEIEAFEEQHRSMAAERLESMAAELRKAGVKARTHVRKGPAADIVAGEADILSSDLIVMGTHGHSGYSRVLLGSQTERTLRLAPCSVLTIRAEEDASA